MLENYEPTRFMAEGSYYDKEKADFAVAFIQCLKHTKGIFSGKPFELIGVARKNYSRYFWHNKT